MDTLYVLCRSVDRRHDSHMEPADADEACDRKHAYFEAEANVNPLVKEILVGGTITCDGLAAHDRYGFLQGPATFFRTHEILRKTQRANTPLIIGGREYMHDEVAAMFDRCVPNAKLTHLPWWSFGRYRMSLGLAWALTLVVAHITARGQDADNLLDPFALYYGGSITTVVALIYTTMKQNRDVRHAAPWNSAMYLDVNATLIRQNSQTLAIARKEYLPQEKPFKTSRFYYSLARKIESHAFETELLQRQSATEPSTADALFQNARPGSPNQTPS